MKKLLKLFIVFIAIYALLSGGLVLVEAFKPNKVIPQDTSQSTIKLASAPNIDDLFVMVNEYRVEKGIKPLMRDVRLDASAANKCSDMISKDYWGHKDPNGLLSGIKNIQNEFDKYKSAGENLYYGNNGTSEVIESWKKSPGHNAAMLNPGYNEVGYAVCYSKDYIHIGARYVVVQHFVQL